MCFRIFFLFFYATASGSLHCYGEAASFESDTLIRRASGYVTGSGPYRPSRTRLMDVLHTDLRLKPDWAAQRLEGEALLTVKPFFYPQNTLSLDAKGFEIKEVSQLPYPGGKGAKQSLRYAYDDRVLQITLEKMYNRYDTLLIRIRYVARPAELARKKGEDRAPERGLYFVNPEGAPIGKPRQMWTQGETDGSSAWFPTIDSPNEKFTQDIRITVEEKLVTLSNGLLKGRQRHPDGTRTDHWRQTLPHAPYLAMLAAGEFAVVKDSVPNLALSYYVEPAYREHAKAIFGRTPGMVAFFSSRFGVAFPWEKYAQIAVRDFVTGAMENTTATVHEEDIQADRRQLIDGNSDAVIAHELAHHWFGNLVTCEEWGQLPLNEAFANYAEYLWTEHAYGADEADWAGQLELQQYLAEAREKKVPMIRYFYEDAGEMFDSHSYARGGRVLHTLRKYVGDEAFFLSLKTYLERHRFGTAELADLRLAFEEVTGEDLNWFFDQWFLRPGHPVLEVSHVFDRAKKEVILRVKQQQDTLTGTVYRLPLKVELRKGAVAEIRDIVLDKPVEEFRFASGEAPDLVNLDPDGVLLGETGHAKSEAELVFQFRYSKGFSARYAALQGLAKSPLTPQTEQVFKEAMAAPFWKIRQEAIQLYSAQGGRKELLDKQIARMALSDSSSLVRAEALAVLAGFREKKYAGLFREALGDSSYAVAGVALDACLARDPEDAAVLIAQFGKIANAAVLSAIGNFYGDHPRPEYFNWFVEKLALLSASGKYRLMQAMGKYLVKSDASVQERSIPYLEGLARREPNYLVRFGAYQLLGWFDDRPGVKERLKNIRETEEEPRLLELFRQLEQI